MIIAIDFDGTIVSHEYPHIGEPNPRAIGTIKALQKMNHQIILWTMRSGDELVEAVEYLKSNGITLWGININPTQHTWTVSRKQYAQLYIDDAALGCPLKFHKKSGRNWANWDLIYKYLVDNKIL